MKTPVVIFIYNRPELVSRLLAILEIVKPPVLYVVADGPRCTEEAEIAAVRRTRELFDRLPWDCQIHRNFAQTNMGCAIRIPSGLSWVFGIVEEAIVLEDDCLPDASFFAYCEELLERYRYDGRIGSICGTCYEKLSPDDRRCYWFSQYCLIWGWATWKRAWVTYDARLDIARKPVLDGVLGKKFKTRRPRIYWKWILQRVERDEINSWSYRWLLSCWRSGLLSIIPKHNLVDNVGFGPDSTHTKTNIYVLPPVEGIEMPLVHPDAVEVDYGMDQKLEDGMFSRSVRNRIEWLLRKLLGWF